MGVRTAIRPMASTFTRLEAHQSVTSMMTRCIPLVVSISDGYATAGSMTRVGTRCSSPRTLPAVPGGLAGLDVLARGAGLAAPEKAAGKVDPGGLGSVPVGRAAHPRCSSMPPNGAVEWDPHQTLIGTPKGLGALPCWASEGCYCIRLGLMLSCGAI